MPNASHMLCHLIVTTLCHRYTCYFHFRAQGNRFRVGQVNVSTFIQLEIDGTGIWIQADLISEPAFLAYKLDHPALHRIFWDSSSQVISEYFLRSPYEDLTNSWHRFSFSVLAAPPPFPLGLPPIWPAIPRNTQNPSSHSRTDIATPITVTLQTYRASRGVRWRRGPSGTDILCGWQIALSWPWVSELFFERSSKLHLLKFLSTDVKLAQTSGLEGSSLVT